MNIKKLNRILNEALYDEVDFSSATIDVATKYDKDEQLIINIKNINAPYESSIQIEGPEITGEDEITFTFLVFNSEAEESVNELSYQTTDYHAFMEHLNKVLPSNLLNQLKPELSSFDTDSKEYIALEELARKYGDKISLADLIKKLKEEK